MEPPPRVFISYSHDSPAHRERVLDLAQRLRRNGVDARIDRFVTSPPEGWPRWMKAEVDRADFVLAVCTETYFQRFEGREEPGKGLGANWEGFLITQVLYDAQARNAKVIPVQWDGATEAHIPSTLRAVKRYRLDSDFEPLLRHLLGRPEVVPEPIGASPELPPRGTTPRTAPVRAPPGELSVVSSGATGPGVWQRLRALNRYFIGRDGRMRIVILGFALLSVVATRFSGFFHFFHTSKAPLAPTVLPSLPPPSESDTSKLITSANFLFQARKYDEAIILCDKILQSDPGNTVASDLKVRISKTKEILNRR